MDSKLIIKAARAVGIPIDELVGLTIIVVPSHKPLINFILDDKKIIYCNPSATKKSIYLFEKIHE